MSEQDGTKAATRQRPTTDDKEAWNNYWKAHGQPWRIEPEIDDERKKYLDERLSIISATCTFALRPSLVHMEPRNS